MPIFFDWKPTQIIIFVTAKEFAYKNHDYSSHTLRNEDDKKTMFLVRVCRWIKNCMRAPTQHITTRILHVIHYFMCKWHVHSARCSLKCFNFVFDKCFVCVFALCADQLQMNWKLNAAHLHKVLQAKFCTASTNLYINFMCIALNTV